MRYLSLADVLRIHQAILRQSGGSAGVRDLGALESAVAQPRMTFSGSELYETPLEKAFLRAVRDHLHLRWSRKLEKLVMLAFT